MISTLATGVRCWLTASQLPVSTQHLFAQLRHLITEDISFYFPLRLKPITGQPTVPCQSKLSRIMLFPLQEGGGIRWIIAINSTVGLV